MRWSLGTAVLCGMAGVTLFGIFLTPVFFYVIEGLGHAALFRRASWQWWGAVVLSAAVGVLCDFLAGKAGFRAGPWALVGGAALSFLVAVLVQGAHRRRHQAARRPAAQVVPDQCEPDHPENQP
jgi:multidrug efflux pump